MRIHRLAILFFLMLGLQASLVAAQTAAPAATPAPAPEELPPPPPPPSYSAPAAAPAACAPACRAGFACVSGQCVSACNPPCGPGEMCGQGGQCIASEPDAPQYNADMTGDSPLAHPGGYEQHDGFMLRLTLGFGGASSKLDDFTFSGPTGAFSLDLGGSVAENLIIHARLADQVMVEPKLTFNGDDFDTADDFTVAAFLFGPAITYYFMPANIYLTGAIGGAWVQYNTDGDDDGVESKAGLGLNIDVGKEWWVSDNWGLGVAGRFWYSAIKDEVKVFGATTETDVDINYVAFSLLFSATYQ